MYKVVDLFAGAGGLSLGFMQTRKYDIKVAFENSPYMQETYRLNHPGVEVHGDVCAANYDEIKEKYGDIDVVIGGPPCQGFSNANRQKNHAISQNNMLVKQYIRAVLELKPKAFVMENVSMLKSDVHRFYMEESDVETVAKYKIPVKSTYLHLLDQAYVFDGALEIVKDQQKIQQYLWPEQHYFELNVIYKAAKNLEKMKSALEKHKKKLCAAAADYAKLHDSNHIASVSAEAFQAISEYYSGELDKKTGEIALFQLKWQDPADYSPFTLKSKRSNYYSAAEKWLEIIEKWLSNSADEDIASKLGVKVKYFDKKKISIFVLGRRRGNYSGNGPYPYECAWSQWYQIMYAASYLRQENEFTISNLYKLIVSTSPFNIKISEKPVTFCYGKYRIKFGGKTFCGKDTR